MSTLQTKTEGKKTEKIEKKQEKLKKTQIQSRRKVQNAKIDKIQSWSKRQKQKFIAHN